ncbi:MAG: hypothetical protein RLZZ297_1072 [Chloroflexota bacterium]|jgi:1-acyl-sn-glycerol-3-phosphate acyltransferase
MLRRSAETIVRTMSALVVYGTVCVLRWLRLLDWRCQRPPRPPAGATRVIYICNHAAWHDIPLLFWALPHPQNVWWFAKAELLRHWMGWWFALLPVIPVSRGTGDTNALRAAIDRVAAGDPLLIFPEGTWDDGRLLRAKTGVIRIACATDAVIVPLAVTGGQLPLWGNTRVVSAGDPFRVADLPSYLSDTPCTNQPLDALTTEAMQHIVALLPSWYHGYYAAESAAV